MSREPEIILTRADLSTPENEETRQLARAQGLKSARCGKELSGIVHLFKKPDENGALMGGACEECRFTMARQIGASEEALGKMAMMEPDEEWTFNPHGVRAANQRKKRPPQHVLTIRH